MVINAPDHPARNVNIQNESVPVSNDDTGILDVGGDGFSRLEEVLHEILDHMKIQTEILKEIAK